MNDSKQDTTIGAAAPAAPPAPPSRPTISISLNKKKRTASSSTATNTHKRSSLAGTSLVEEYSTIAAQAKSISQRRREEGEVLVIPCRSNAGGAEAGDKPLLLAKREMLLRPPPTNDNPDVHITDDTGQITEETASVLPPNKSDNDAQDGIEDDIEATLQLIQSADHRRGNTNTFNDGPNRSGVVTTIAAPSKNEIHSRFRTTTTTTTTMENDEELFRRDLSHRADDIDPTSSTYAQVSIHDFGGALLRGMGWTGGGAVSGGGDASTRNTSSGSEIKARPHRLGLGATPLLPPVTGGKGSGSGVVRRARRPEEVKREEERMRFEEERERERLEKQRLDVQWTLQRESVVWVYGDADDGGGDGTSRLKARARVVQTAGVPGLNRILIRMEDGRERSVNKGSVELCSWEELEANPFQTKEKVVEDREKNGKREERQNLRDDAKSKRDTSNNKLRDNNTDNYGDERSEDRYDRKPNDQHHSERRRDDTKNGHRRGDYSDDDSHYRQRRKTSSRHKHYNDSDDDDSHHRRRRKESSRDKHYSDDDSHSKRKRKESSRRKRDRSEERDRSHSRTKHRDREGRDDRRRDKDDSKRSRHSSSTPQNDNQHQQHLNWLLPNIRVRLVSKRYPRQHLQKGIVQDVIPSSKNNNPKAVILMDNQEVLDNIPERYLETALPRTGGNVIVLEGCHRWKKGRLLERSSERSRGIIQLFEDLEVVEVSLDGVAEWCGPIDEDLS